MDDDWDLHAVVRGYAATGTTDKTNSSNPFPSSSSLPFNSEENSLDFSGFIDERMDPFQGLQEIYREFCTEPPPHVAAVDSTPVGQSHLHSQPHHEIVQIPQSQMNIHRGGNVMFKNPTFGSDSLTFPATNSQPVRSRRRKNQQMKIVREMTQEELSADSWAWRKYGQKPIKGSPYPRNYYRCSTSKGCAARKQVERSPNDPSIFVVSYTGEHTHPRPTHRSSLAGSTRSKISPANKHMITPLLPKGSLSSPATASGSSFSASTPEGEAASQNDVDVEMADDDDDEDNNNIIMIQSDLMNDDEDIFKGFQDSDHSSGG